MPDPESTPAPSSNSQLRIIFIGPHGVRAGWRLLVFFALLVAVGFAIMFAARRIIGNLGTDFSARKIIIDEMVGFGIVLIATAIMGRFEHRSLADYGLPFRFVLGKQFWAGALWGFVMLSVIVGMMAASGAYSFGGLALSPADVLKYGLLWALAFLLVGFFEEFSFRGYLQYTLTSGMGFWPAAGITCVIFAGLHLGNPGENWIGAVEIVLIALFLCLALAPHRQSLVRHRLAHGLRLGRELLLLHAQQRHSRHRTHVEGDPVGIEVAERRHRRTGSQRLRSGGHCRRHPVAGQNLSGRKISYRRCGG